MIQGTINKEVFAFNDLLKQATKDENLIEFFTEYHRQALHSIVAVQLDDLRRSIGLIGAIYSIGGKVMLRDTQPFKEIMQCLASDNIIENSKFPPK